MNETTTMSRTQTFLDQADRYSAHNYKPLPVVLDEVDRMLDIGFIDDIRRLLRTIKQPHQTVFVSATISAVGRFMGIPSTRVWS